jgi:prolipoprotein diacylglyceryltransferase
MNEKELTLYGIFFILGMLVSYYFMQANTECMVKFTKSGGETHMLVGIIK